MQTDPEKASLLQVFRMVFSAFFGVRGRGEHEKLRITPLQVIIAAIIAAALFVAAIVTVVRLVTH